VGFFSGGCGKAPAADGFDTVTMPKMSFHDNILQPPVQTKTVA
jgi:hypothetical protein